MALVLVPRQSVQANYGMLSALLLSAQTPRCMVARACLHSFDSTREGTCRWPAYKPLCRHSVRRWIFVYKEGCSGPAGPIRTTLRHAYNSRYKL